MESSKGHRSSLCFSQSVHPSTFQNLINQMVYASYIIKAHRELAFGYAPVLTQHIFLFLV